MIRFLNSDRPLAEFCIVALIVLWIAVCFALAQFTGVLGLVLFFGGLLWLWSGRS